MKSLQNLQFYDSAFQIESNCHIILWAHLYFLNCIPTAPTSFTLQSNPGTQRPIVATLFHYPPQPSSPGPLNSKYWENENEREESLERTFCKPHSTLAYVDLPKKHPVSEGISELLTCRYSVPRMSAVPTWLGAVAAGMAVSSYVDAKFNLSSDIENILSRRAAFAGLTKAGKMWTPFPLPPAHAFPS